MILLLNILAGGVGMARGDVDKVDKTTDFFQYMFNMRKSLKFIDALVKQLEDLPDDDDLSQDFCISYVIELLRTYCENDDDYELALASYGFLEGFERTRYKGIQKRTEEYWRYASKYDKHEFIEADWSTGSALTELKDAHIVIIGYLDKRTSEIKSKNEGKLGLFEKVPKNLEFPKPRKIENTIDTLKNGTSYINPNNESENHQPNAEHNTELKNETLKSPSPKPLEPEISLTNKNSIEQEGNEQKIPDTNNISICEEAQDTSTKNSGIQVSTNANNLSLIHI